MGLTLTGWDTYTDTGKAYNVLSFFFFGVLQDPDLREVVIGRPVPPEDVEEGVLHGYRRVRIRARVQPVLIADGTCKVHGVVVYGLDEIEAGRLSYYEGKDYYAAKLVVRLVNNGLSEAWVFLPREQCRLADEDWDFRAWHRRFKKRSLTVAREWMARLDDAEHAAEQRQWAKRRDVDLMNQ